MTVYNFTGSQTITNFNPATDVISEGSQSVSASQFVFGGVGGSTTITDPSGNVLTLSGIATNQLTTTNFNFLGGSHINVGADNTTAALNVLANSHTLTGAGADQVLELGGNDTINDSTTGGGNFIRGGSGNDTVTISSSTAVNDTIVAGGGADSINASTVTSGPETIWAANYAAYTGHGTFAGGNDSITTGLDGGYYHGSTGNSTFQGGANLGSMTIIAGHGNDSIVLGNASAPAVLAGGKGADTITDASVSGHDTLSAGNFQNGNPVVGSAGNGFSISGSAAANTADVFYGDGGNGTITSGTGINETVNGGAGAVSITSSTVATSITGSTFNMQKGNSTFTTAGAVVNFDTVVGGSGTDVFNVITGVATRQLDVLIGSGATTVNDTATGAQGINNFVETAGTSTGVDTFNIQLNAATTDTANIVGGLKTTDFVALTETHDLGADTITVSSNTLAINNTGTGGTLTITNMSTAGVITDNNSGTSSTLYYNYGGTATTLGSSTATLNNAVVSNGGGADTIDTGTAGNDSIYVGTNDADLVIHHSTGTDTIHSLNNSATIEMSGADTIATFGTNVTGFDHIVGIGGGAKTITIAASLVGGNVTAGTTVTIDGSAATGAITLTSFAGDDGTPLVVKGGTGIDSLDLSANTGTEGATVTGGAAAGVVVKGPAGASSLVGGAGGLDTVTGGAGADTIVAGASSTHGDSLTGGAGVDDFKFSTASLVATPTAGEIHDAADFTTGTDKMMFQSLTAGFTVGQATDSTANDTIANVLALNATLNSVEVVKLTGATETGFTGGVANPAQNDFVLVVQDSSANKYIVYTGTAHSAVTADFIMYA